MDYLVKILSVQTHLNGKFSIGANTAHLQSYLNEFTFCFYRRESKSRGLDFRRLLKQSVVTEPVIDSELAHRYNLIAPQYSLNRCFCESLFRAVLPEQVAKIKQPQMSAGSAAVLLSWLNTQQGVFNMSSQ